VRGRTFIDAKAKLCRLPVPWPHSQPAEATKPQVHCAWGSFLRGLLAQKCVSVISIT